MEVRFADKELERLDSDLGYLAGFDRSIVTAFRKRMGFIRAACDERDLRNFKSWRYKKLKGDRSHQRSIRLNDQWRLIVEIETEKRTRVVAIIKIEDSH